MPLQGLAKRVGLLLPLMGKEAKAVGDLGGRFLTFDSKPAKEGSGCQVASVAIIDRGQW